MNTNITLLILLTNTISRRVFKCLLVLILFGSLQLTAQSSEEFTNGGDKLVVYKDVPGLAPSEFYTIKVRSALTGNQWVDCFANITRNKANIPESEGGVGSVSVPQVNNNNKIQTTTVYHYQKYTGAWSHTFGNIEITPDTPIEVEISNKNGFQIDGQDFYKATVHPAQKASLASVVNGKIYFTISNPGQVVIDINGQMDDFNKAIDDNSPDQSYVAHTISFFANPIMVKPVIGGPGVVVVEPGVQPTTNQNSYTTLYFKPGVHNLDPNFNFKVHPGKNYYIPGDAIVYGTFNNFNVPIPGGLQSGENIKIYGYGTISGAKTTHPNYVPGGADDTEYKSIAIDNGMNVEVQGITVVDPANHSINLNAWSQRPNQSQKVTFVRWAKVISWRANGDGVGSAHVVEDCFLRTADDCSYIKGDRTRCVFWKDANAAVFHMSGITTNFPIVIQDCDVIYNRTRGVNGGGVFVQRGQGVLGQRTVDVTVRDFRVTDPRSNMPTFNLFSQDGTDPSGSSFSGITFENVTITHETANGVKQKLQGSVDAPWDGGLFFNNVTIAGRDLCGTDFSMNQYVSNIIFPCDKSYTLTTNADSVKGLVTADPDLVEYVENSSVTLTAVANLGYQFTGWSGDATGTDNPLDLVMNSNKVITANFSTAALTQLTTTAVNGTITMDPVGPNYSQNTIVTLTAKPEIGYKFIGWSGDFSGTDIISSITMNANKSVTANFVKTNSFAINCGGDQYIALDGTVYSSDNSITSGVTTKSDAIANTHDDVLYQSLRNGDLLGDLIYTLPVDNGNDYTVTLKFAELWWQATGKRSFNATIEGVNVLSGIDLFDITGGRYVAYDRTFNVTVSDGELNIVLTGTINRPVCNAIQVTKASDVVLSVPKEELNNAIQIYPNPVSDKLYIKSVLDDIKKIEMIDLTGKVIYTNKVIRKSETIDLVGISTGLYLIRIYTADKVFTEKVVVK